MPRLQAAAAIAFVPTAWSVSRPRTVWVTGVKGWYSANWRSPGGMVSVGTNPLLSKGSRVRNRGVLWPSRRFLRPARGPRKARRARS